MKFSRSDDISARNSKYSQDQMEMHTLDSIFNDSELFDEVASLSKGNYNVSNKRQRVSMEP